MEATEGKLGLLHKSTHLSLSKTAKKLTNASRIPEKRPARKNASRMQGVHDNCRTNGPIKLNFFLSALR